MSFAFIYAVRMHACMSESLCAHIHSYAFAPSCTLHVLSFTLRLSLSGCTRPRLEQFKCCDVCDAKAHKDCFAQLPVCGTGCVGNPIPEEDEEKGTDVQTDDAHKGGDEDGGSAVDASLTSSVAGQVDSTS